MEIVKNVGIIIHTNDNRSKEIPIEPWQMDVIALILGLQVNLKNLDEYQMSSKADVEERMKLYKNAIKSIPV